MSPVVRGITPLALLLAAACSPPAPVPDGGQEPPCEGCDLTCPAGFLPLDGGAGCVALRTAAACAPGTMPRLGATDCAPVGVRGCPPGFVTDGSGWGCRDVTSATRCTGATREKLGETGCVPVGDCAAAFPPPSATHFVSAAYTPGQLDGTHFDTIAGAVAAADAGAVIAIDEGTYVGSVVPARPVTLWGRCPERVVVVPTDGGTNVGVRLVDLSGSVVKGLTVRGFPGGVAVFGGSAELSDLVVEGNTIGGVIASNGGTAVRLRNSVVRSQRARPNDRQTAGAYVQRGAVLTVEETSLSDNEFVGAVVTNPDAGLILRRSIVRDGFPIAQGPVVGTFGVGAYAVDGAWLQIEESVIAGNTTEGVLIARGGTRPAFGTVLRSTVRDTKKNAAVEDMARGIEAGKASTLHVEECTVTGNAEHEILVTEEARATIVNTTTVGSTDVGAPSGTGLLVSYDAGVVATSFAAIRPRAVGVSVENQSTLSLEGAYVAEPVLATPPISTSGPQAIAVDVKAGGALAMKGGMLFRARGVAMLLNGGRAQLDGVAIVDTLSRYGLSGRGVSVQEGAVFSAVNSAIVGSREAGIVTFDPGSVASLTNTSIEDTQADEFGNFGIGALATTGASLELNACTVTRSATIGIAASAAPVAVRASFVSFNPTGLHAQDGVSISTQSQVSLAPGVLGVSEDTRFVGNAQATGLGTVPIPGK